MNKQDVARELMAVARELSALEFGNPEALSKYLRSHPGSSRSDHKVVKNPKVHLPSSHPDKQKGKKPKTSPTVNKTKAPNNKGEKPKAVVPVKNNKGEKPKAVVPRSKKKVPQLKLPKNHPGKKVPVLKLPKKSAEAARELLVVAREMVGATKDLGEIRAILPEMHKKQEEYERVQEEQQRHRNRMWVEATKDMHKKTDELLEAINKALVNHFEGNDMGTRKSGVTGGLVEVFLGSRDGVKRYQSKVSTNIAMTFKGSETFTYMLRNENLDDISGNLEDKNTVAKLIAVVKKADKSGFWEEPGYRR